MWHILARCGILSEVRHMPLSPKKAASNKKWEKANVTRRGTVLPNALNDRMVARAAELGMTVNGYIRHLIEADLASVGE